MNSANAPFNLYDSQWKTDDPGTGAVIRVRKWGSVYPLDIAAGVAETNTVQHPDRAGIVVSLCARTVGSAGTRAITFPAAITANGDTVATFATAGDRLTLRSYEVAADTFRWKAEKWVGVTGLVGEVGGASQTATAAELIAIADLSANGAIIKTKVLSISAAPTGAEQDTTFDLPAKAMLLDVYVNVTAAEATGGTKTLNVGLKAAESGGDADGFIAGISVATTGLKRAGVALDGGSAYFDTTTRGLLLRNFVQGAGTDDRGLYNEKPHASDSVTAKSVVYTAGSNDFVEFRGSIVLVYVEVA